MADNSPADRFADKKITPRTEDYSQWYLDIIAVADMAEHSPVKGCMVIKPYGYAIWENMQRVLDAKFKESGVENAYFPLFIPQSFLQREAEHVEGFSPELAVVTHAGGKELEEPLVVRPTSETVMYDVFSNWIHSYRDLPLLINQWANIVRWEKRPRLFLRTTEFLWQEGHTAHATEAEAVAKAREMLEVYKWFAEEYMAIPVLTGVKSESEKFAGAVATYAIEAMMQDGKALQMGTSHMLGQNFAKVFNVKFLDQNSTEQYVWQTSWGVSTRMIGGLIMAHSDDNGLVMPPKLATIQAIITTIGQSGAEDSSVINTAENIKTDLLKKGIRAKVDDRDKRPGEKFFEWEKKGVPVRIELGPKDVANNSAILVRRDTGEKQTVALSDLVKTVNKLLVTIQKNLFKKALAYRKARTKKADSWSKFVKLIDEGNFVLAHWSGDADVETAIKDETGATVRCIPFDQPAEEGKCIKSGKPSHKRVIFAKSY